VGVNSKWPFWATVWPHVVKCSVIKILGEDDFTSLFQVREGDEVKRYVIVIGLTQTKWPFWTLATLLQIYYARQLKANM